MKALTTVAALYHFNQKPIENLKKLQELLLTSGKEEKIQGTLLIAEEGINGTIAGSEMAIKNILKIIKDQLGLKSLNWKKSKHHENPFYRFKVKIKK